MTLGVELVPLVAERPTECGELAVNHAPLEIAPRTQRVDAVFLFKLLCRPNRALPHSANDRLVARRASPRILLHELQDTALDLVLAVLVSVVPDLIRKSLLGLEDVGERAGLHRPGLLKHRLRNERRIDMA